MGVFACSAIAFLARETGWLAVITALWAAGSVFGKASFRNRIRLGLILLALLAGTIPHSIYAHAHAVHTPPLYVASLFKWNPKYWLDVFVKGGFCFHIVWLLVAWRLWRAVRERRLAMPPSWMMGWTLGCGLYMTAAYAANDVTSTGYPMRIAYSLFPLIYLWVEELFESGAIQWRPHLLAVLLCVAQLGIGLTGILLDPGTRAVTAPGLMKLTRGDQPVVLGRIPVIQVIT